MWTMHIRFYQSFLITGRSMCVHVCVRTAEKQRETMKGIRGRQIAAVHFVLSNAHVCQSCMNFNNHPEGLFFLGHILLNVSLSF